MDNLTKVHIVALIAIGLLLIWQDAHSDVGQIWGEYHVGSVHSQSYWYDENHSRHEFNEDNTGGGISYEASNHVEFGAGFFRNSYNNTSVYAGIDLHSDARRPLRIGISVAPITGYRDTPMNSDWMLLPNVVTKVGNVRTKIGWIPVGKVKVLTLTVGIGF